MSPDVLTSVINDQKITVYTGNQNYSHRMVLVSFFAVTNQLQLQYRISLSGYSRWTADEYEAWMNEQKKEMESLIGTGDGWYDGEGVFHEFTQESVAAMMDSYKGTLESIKKGVLYSKDNGDGDTYSMIPPTEDVVSSYSVNVTKDNGKTVHIGDYSKVEELDKAISDAVKNGQLTQEEADAVHQ